jgi:RsiW-degrading membrane proteinase PrsW (M82 family)
MNHELICILAALISIFLIIAYVIICLEFPRNGFYRYDPWWMIILKSWGGILLFVGSYFCMAIIIDTIWGLKK